MQKARVNALPILVKSEETGCFYCFMFRLHHAQTDDLRLSHRSVGPCHHHREARNLPSREDHLDAGLFSSIRKLKCRLKTKSKVSPTESARQSSSLWLSLPMFSELSSSTPRRALLQAN